MGQLFPPDITIPPLPRERGGVCLRRHLFAQPAAHADGLYAEGEARLIVGFDIGAAEGAVAEGGLVAFAGELGDEAGERVLLLHANDAVIVAAHASIGLIGSAVLEDHRVSCGHMGVRADDKAGAAVAMVAHGHLLARCLAMHVDDDGIGHGAERHGIERGIDGLERIDQCLAHEDIALRLDDADAATIWQGIEMGALARRIGRWRIVQRAQEARLALDICHGLALVPGMVAEGEAVGAGTEEIVRDGFGEAKTAGRILGIHDNEIEPQARLEPRQVLQHGSPAGLANDISEKCNLHGQKPMPCPADKEKRASPAGNARHSV